jgi:CRP-like cAMP-binding protein
MSRSSKARPKSARTDRDGNQIHNEILLHLPNDEWGALLPKVEFVQLKARHLLHETGQTIKSVYFINSGLASILSVMSDGRSVEVGLTGKEGFVGLAVIAGFRRSSTRVVAQVDATAFRLDTDVLAALLHHCPQLTHLLLRFSQAAAVQVAQLSACNRLHQVDERLARWLLMTQDRIGSKHLPLTQDLLAQMLGTRRSSVTLAAGKLQRGGMIAYARGNVTVVNRHRLEGVACECYELIRQHLE